MTRQDFKKTLIIVHDLVMTAFAVVATFFVRFDGILLTDHLRKLPYVLPPFVLFAGFVYWFFQLYRSKWRFASLPDLYNIFRASSVLALGLLVVDYILVSPQLFGFFFFGKITIALYWLIQMFFLGGPRLAFRYIKYAQSRQTLQRDANTPTLLLGRGTDIEVMLRAIESGSVKKLQPHGRSVVPRRRSRPVDPGRSGPRHLRGSRPGGAGFPRTRRADPPAGGDPERAGAGSASRHADRPRAPSRPAAGARHLAWRRHAGRRTGAARNRRPAAAPDGADRPGAAGEFHSRQARSRHRRRRLHRVGNLHPRGGVRRQPPAGARELRTVAASNSRKSHHPVERHAGGRRNRRCARPRARARGHERLFARRGVPRRRA